MPANTEIHSFLYGELILGSDLTIDTDFQNSESGRNAGEGAAGLSNLKGEMGKQTELTAHAMSFLTTSLNCLKPSFGFCRHRRPVPGGRVFQYF
jgi:hypothetical protein